MVKGIVVSEESTVPYFKTIFLPSIDGSSNSNFSVKNKIVIKPRGFPQPPRKMQYLKLGSEFFLPHPAGFICHPPV
jgi:hypothetical protein